MQAKYKASFRLVLFYDFWHELATPTAAGAAAADDDEDNVVDLPREYKQTKTEGEGELSFVRLLSTLSVLAESIRIRICIRIRIRIWIHPGAGTAFGLASQRIGII